MKHARSLTLAFALSLVSLVGCGDSSTAATDTGPFRTPTVATLGGGFQAPLDAAPTPDGGTIYFVARGGTNGPGLYRVAATGGTAAEVSVGAPFVTPRGLAISSDGQRIVVADATAGMRGGLYVVSASGGTPMLLPGTEGTAPQGVEIATQDGADQVYFTGTSSNGPAAVYRIPLAGGALTTLAQGGMLSRPQGIAITRAGVVYVSDRADSATGVGAIYRIQGTSVMPVVNNVRLGDPAGIALAPDDSVLGVSSLDARTGTCQVLLVNLATGMTSVFNNVISANRAAGGVHRAHGGASTNLAWSDLTAGGRGTVYRIEFR